MKYEHYKRLEDERVTDEMVNKDRVEDLKKAQNYLSRLIQEVTNG